MIGAVEGSLGGGDVPAEVLAVVDARLANNEPRPDADAITLDDFEARVRTRRTA